MMELLHFVIAMLMMIMVKSVESQGSTVVAGIKQYNPNCDMLDGFRKEECEFNKENAGLSGVSWWAWGVLAGVLTLIILVILRMICSRKLSTSSNNRVPVTQKQRKQQQNKHLTVNHSTISKDSNPPLAKPQQQQQELVSTATAFETVEAYPAPEYYQYSEAGSGQYYQYYDGQYYGHGQYLPPYQHYPEHHGALETSHMQQSMNLGEHAHPYDGHVQFRDETQGMSNVPYAHVRYTTSDNIYTV